ncbi:MAG: hypothetical protein K2K60_03605 [Clostridia bacterium]|nr:hypothetical protein [Clostridia bacterium]
MKKKIIFVLAAVIMVFACTFSFAGCELANNVQKNCNHMWIRDRNSSSLRPATCSEKGIKAVYNCIKCMDTKYEYTDTLPHTYDENSTSYTATCSSLFINKKCTVCDNVSSQRIDVEAHDYGTPVYHEMYEATLVDIGLFTQEEYDELSPETIEYYKNNNVSLLREKNTCAYTERKCTRCKHTEKIYEHNIDENHRIFLNQLIEEERANGNCGGSLWYNCDFCGEDGQLFCHDFEEAEVIYSSETLIVKKLLCKYCHTEEKYDVQFL